MIDILTETLLYTGMNETNSIQGRTPPGCGINVVHHPGWRNLHPGLQSEPPLRGVQMFKLQCSGVSGCAETPSVLTVSRCQITLHLSCKSDIMRNDELSS